MNNSYLNQATNLASIIERHYQNKVLNVTPSINPEDNYPWFAVEFLLYRTYKFMYEYEKGFFGIFSKNQDNSGINFIFSKENQNKFINHKSDNASIKNNLDLLDYEVRLRLPNKFLSTFD